LRGGRKGIDSRQGLGFFSSSPRPDRLSGPHNLLSDGYWGFFPGDKTAGSRSLPLTSVSRLGMRGAVTTLPKYVFMAWYLVKRRDNFTFYTSYI